MTGLRDKIQLVCTDRRQHPEAEIALIEWHPVRGDDDREVHIWEPGQADGMRAEIVTENVRSHRKGGTTSHVVRKAAEWRIHADGRRTLLAHCVRCRRQWERREEWVNELRRSPGTDPVDLSFVD